MHLHLHGDRSLDSLSAVLVLPAQESLQMNCLKPLLKYVSSNQLLLWVMMQDVLQMPRCLLPKYQVVLNDSLNPLQLHLQPKLFLLTMTIPKLSPDQLTDLNNKDFPNPE